MASLRERGDEREAEREWRRALARRHHSSIRRRPAGIVRRHHPPPVFTAIRLRPSSTYLLSPTSIWTWALIWTDLASLLPLHWHRLGSRRRLPLSPAWRPHEERARTPWSFFLSMESMKVIPFKQQQQDGFSTAKVGLATIIEEMIPIRILAVDDSFNRLQLILILVWKQVSCLFIFGIKRSYVRRPTIPDAFRNSHSIYCLIDGVAAAKRHEQAVLSPEVYCPDCKDLGVQEYLTLLNSKSEVLYCIIMQQSKEGLELLRGPRAGLGSNLIFSKRHPAYFNFFNVS